MNPGICRILLASVACFGISGIVSAGEISFTVDEWIIEGDNPLASPVSQRILAPYLGKQTGLDGLQKAAADLEKRLVDDGYTFYRVVLPPQSIESGTVRLQVFPFAVEDVTIEGNEHHSDENIRASLPELREGESPNAVKLSRNLGLANLNSSKRAKLTFGASDQQGKLNARVEVTDRDPSRFYLWANNTGSEETGNYRLGAGYQNSNFLGRDHQLNATFTTSPTQPGDVQQYGATWRIPHYASNGLFNLLATRSDADSGRIAGFNVKGSGEILGLSYSKVLKRQGNYRQIATLSVADKLFDSDVDFSGEDIGADVRSRPLRLDYQGEIKHDTATTQFNIAALGNLSGGSLNDDAAYAAARTGAQQSWSLFRFGTSAQRTFNGKRFGISLAAQYTDDPLISGEQFGAGGVYTVRGFREREYSADRGIRLAFEILAPKWKNGLRFGWFLEGSSLERLNPQPSEIERQDISSTGLIANWQYGRRLQIDTHFAYVLHVSDERIPGATKEGDERVHFNVTYFHD